MGSPCPTSRTGIQDALDSCERMLLAMAEGWMSRRARCCQSRRCCPRRRSRRAGCPRSLMGRSLPPLLAKWDAQLLAIRDRCREEKMWRGKRRRGFADSFCCNRRIPRFDQGCRPPLIGPILNLNIILRSHSDETWSRLESCKIVTQRKRDSSVVFAVHTVPVNSVDMMIAL